MYHLYPDSFKALYNIKESISSSGAILEGKTLVNYILTNYSLCDVLYNDASLFEQMVNNFVDEISFMMLKITHAYNYVNRLQGYDPINVSIVKEGSNSGTGTGENKVSAFNDSDYSPDNKQSTTTSGTYKDTTTKPPDGKSLQDILQQEIDFSLNNDMYRIVGDKFADELLICVWQ